MLITKYEKDVARKGIIRNLTPHPVTIAGIIIPPEKAPARVSVEKEVVGDILGIPVFKATYGRVEGLPEQVNFVTLIVSRLVKEACPDRADLFCPSGLVRGEDGSIIGAAGLE